MKDLTKYFIDLRKLSEEERKVVYKILSKENVFYYTNLSDMERPLLHYGISENKCGWLKATTKISLDKTELTYPEFIKLFEGGEGETQVSFSMDEMIAFGKKCFYKGFDKCETDDANCYTAWREEAGLLIEQIKH